MPSIKDFEKKAKHKKHKHSPKVAEEVLQEAGSEPVSKRRPGRTNEDGEAIDAGNDHASAEYVATAKESPREETHGAPAAEANEADKFHLEFYGSEMLRAKAPEVFELAEAVVDDWQKNGDFRTLPLKNPWAQMAAAEGLSRAKKVEKKLEEVGVIPMAKMGFEFIKAKLKK